MVRSWLRQRRAAKRRDIARQAGLASQAGMPATFIVGELISYVVDFSGDPGSSYLDRVRAGCPVRAACTKENAHSAEQTASRAWFYIII